MKQLFADGHAAALADGKMYLISLVTVAKSKQLKATNTRIY